MESVTRGIAVAAQLRYVPGPPSQCSSAGEQPRRKSEPSRKTAFVAVAGAAGLHEGAPVTAAKGGAVEGTLASPRHIQQSRTCIDSTATTLQDCVCERPLGFTDCVWKSPLIQPLLYGPGFGCGSESVITFSAVPPKTSNLTCSQGHSAPLRSRPPQPLYSSTSVHGRSWSRSCRSAACRLELCDTRGPIAALHMRSERIVTAAGAQKGSHAWPYGPP